MAELGKELKGEQDQRVCCEVCQPSTRTPLSLSRSHSPTETLNNKPKTKPQNFNPKPQTLDPKP